MWLTSGENCCKSLYIFEEIKKAFNVDSMTWCKYVSLRVDNINAMVGKGNSVASDFLKKNNQIFISRFPCHLANIAAIHGHNSFSNCVGLYVENICIGSFDKISKRNGRLLEYFEFCNQEFQTVLKHLSVRRHSLELCLSYQSYPVRVLILPMNI